MNKKLQAIQDFKKLSIQLRGILGVADELEQLGSLEQALAEAQSAVLAKRDELKTTEKEITAKQAALQEKYVAESRQMSEELNALRASIDAARGERSTLESSIASHQALLGELEDLSAVRAAIDAARQEQTAIDASIAERRALLDNVEEKLRAIVKTF